MKITIPKSAKYEPFIKAVGQIREVKADEPYWTVTVEEDAIFLREWSGLSVKAFRKLCRSIKVEGGTKRYNDEEATFSVLRKHIFKVRLSKTEKDAVEDAAEKLGKAAADFVRESAVSRAKKILQDKATAKP